MNLKFHSTILAVSLAATVAVGFASAAIITDHQGVAAPKGDRLAVVTSSASAGQYVTVETRRDGLSELSRVPLN